jgi:peroxiredoxin
VGFGAAVVSTVNDRIVRGLRYAAYAAVGGFLLLQLSRRATSGPSVGTVAEQFDLAAVTDTAGERVRLADYRGRAVLLEVFASWCGACRRSSPTLVETWQAYRKSGVEFLAVSIDDHQTAKDVKQAWNIPYQVAIDDGSVSKNYSVSVLPTFVLIDREGKVRRVSTGVPSRSQLDTWFKDL